MVPEIIFHRGKKVDLYGGGKNCIKKFDCRRFNFSDVSLALFFVNCTGVYTFVQKNCPQFLEPKFLEVSLCRKYVSS